ncbi:glutathione S-transferase [Pseudomonas sp. GP01-A8]|nr:glutathione S-transferase [Pseudomonas sp. MF6787]PMU22507.1 glutathione S-transferase [Pseudomonas sp. GP01-A9]PMU27864.1 glutathione S-transferase [Pseudomonas sp. GP01-A13]PMU37277.1 glutathione S-transferase [Pseudomonas sp. GP01-A8]PMU51210.1 glutathione S-transferase [Pseudomonas sp. GP01-A14]PMU51895.1 glutathione S-transferase [Pseudomonas sp. GP01-A6]PMU64563.1 glutathione S-transferase [Pseudomonas sp. GP01-A3]PMU67759.1 glutathione S-transferase [Pseudomonas sp. FW215-L2]PMU72
MIKLHHLNASRSIRILWLLEEIGQPYELIKYQRDEKTHLAPASLKAMHPLGKSPVIELDGKVIAESGAMMEILIKRFAPHLAPDEDSAEYIDYLTWIHFSESSAMLPFLLKVFNEFEIKSGTDLKFLEDYAGAEFDKVFSYLDDYLKDRRFLVEDRLTGADFMLGFVVKGALNWLKPGSKLHIERYVRNLENQNSYIRALRIDAN